MGRPAVVAVSVIASTLGFGLAAHQGPPTFRASAEAIVIDASVLDRDRHAVRGLTAADFTILEDGRPQEVRTFKEIDLGGDKRPPEPVWSAAHPPDVRRNAEDIGRERFAAAGEADYRVELPVSTLAPGQYLLEIAAADGRSTVRRELRFERQ